ncbi:hypothetical protein [Sulfurovum sp.]|uniref:hypothetical protein n=1 Tax=Sulfurovum sp. TaxID=1969726 RepID=UPI002867FEA2|nr:hypothetical protein [Sulfurovum sp.]
MKKTLLLSVVASTMIMAGGDIAPVEPVVEAPVMVEEASAWTFGGQAVAYTQTTDNYGDGSLFDDESTYAAWGGQLRATNSDIFAGIGAGIEVSGIVSDEGDLPGFYPGGGNAGTTSGGFTQAYLTYGMDSINTSIKLGRQTLPKSLSPFAYSEGWQMFKNTFDAALVVNSSLPDTTLVYAFVKNANSSVNNYADEDSFGKVNGSDGAHMFTAMNKSIEGITLTGTYYNLPDAADILWGDIKTKFGGLSIAGQGGQIDPDGGDAGTAWGAKLGYDFGMFDASVAYSSVSDDGVQFSNLTGIKSPLYTQMVLNNVGQFHAAPDSDFLKVAASAKALGGKFTLGYGDAESQGTDFTEIDVMYKTKLTENTTLFAAYVYTDIDTAIDSTNFVRFWARYNF